MDAAMYKALSGAIVQMRRLEGAAQDLANLNTSGYKGEKLAFTEVLAPALEVHPGRGRIGGLVAVAEQRWDFSQGSLRTTGNPLDLALEGEGFFVVQTPQGLRYTRQGVFTLSSEGRVVTPRGYPLMGRLGPLTVTGKRVEVNPEGAVRVDGEEVDRIRVARFSDFRVLVREGESLFRAPEDQAQLLSELPEDLQGSTRVLQGHLEEANVNPIEIMVHLITLQRHFEAYERAMRLMDSATQRMLSDGVQIP